MAVFRRPGSDNWWISVYRSGLPRLRVSSGVKDRGAAEIIERTLKAAHGRQTDPERLCAVVRQLAGGNSPPGLTVTLDQAASVYASLPHDLAPTTLRKRLTDIRRFVRWCQANWPSAKTMADVDRRVVLAWSDGLRAKVRRKTYNNVRSNLQTVWQQLMVRAGLAENPWQVATRNLRLTDSRHGRAFSEAEEQRLLQECRRHADWYGASLVARYTGLRLSDVAGLRWENIQCWDLVMTPSKTKRHGVEVRIPLHRRVFAWLVEQQHDASGYLFPVLHHRHRIQKYSTEYGKILRAAGIHAAEGEVVGFHTWRHTFRTRLAAAGVSADVARKLGGWTQEATAARYDHDRTQLEQAIKKLS